MSDEPQIVDSSSDSPVLKRIRSAHRRRLLDRLTDGGTTVSILARDTGLRIPHASAELRRMRNDGLSQVTKYLVHVVHVYILHNLVGRQYVRTNWRGQFRYYHYLRLPAIIAYLLETEQIFC